MRQDLRWNENVRWVLLDKTWSIMITHNGYLYFADYGMKGHEDLSSLLWGIFVEPIVKIYYQYGTRCEINLHRGIITMCSVFWLQTIKICWTKWLFTTPEYTSKAIYSTRWKIIAVLVMATCILISDLVNLLNKMPLLRHWNIVLWLN